MTNTEFFAFLFVGFLAAIVFGIFIGIALADRRKQRFVRADNSKLEQVREGAFARIDGRRPKFRSRQVLDAEKIEGLGGFYPGPDADVLDAEVID